MCFRNLPIELDPEGNARLRPGTADPYSVHAPLRTPMSGRSGRSADLVERAGAVLTTDVARVTRVLGDIAIDVVPLLELIERGCPPDLAVRIAAPLEWEPPAAATG